MEQPQHKRPRKQEFSTTTIDNNKFNNCVFNLVVPGIDDGDMLPDIVAQMATTVIPTTSINQTRPDVDDDDNDDDESGFNDSDNEDGPRKRKDTSHKQRGYSKKDLDKKEWTEEKENIVLNFNNKNYDYEPHHQLSSRVNPRLVFLDRHYADNGSNVVYAFSLYSTDKRDAVGRDTLIYHCMTSELKEINRALKRHIDVSKRHIVYHWRPINLIVRVSQTPYVVKDIRDKIVVTDQGHVPDFYTVVDGVISSGHHYDDDVRGEDLIEEHAIDDPVRLNCIVVNNNYDDTIVNKQDIANNSGVRSAEHHRDVDDYDSYQGDECGVAGEYNGHDIAGEYSAAKHGHRDNEYTAGDGNGNINGGGGDYAGDGEYTGGEYVGGGGVGVDVGVGVGGGHDIRGADSDNIKDEITETQHLIIAADTATESGSSDIVSVTLDADTTVVQFMPTTN